MLHMGILAYHGGWRAFFQELRYVVLADVQQAVGAFGAHLAHLLRRLYRLAHHYGAQPQYLLTSAPLANMVEVAHTLTAQVCTVVTGETRGTQPQSWLLLESQDDPVNLCPTLMARHQEAGIEPTAFAPGHLCPRWPTACSPQVCS